MTDVHYLIPPFNAYLLNAYYVPDSVLVPGDTAVNKKNEIHSIRELMYLWVMKDIKFEYIYLYLYVFKFYVFHTYSHKHI